jgi:DNA-binding response OmpR family regulator
MERLSEPGADDSALEADRMAAVSMTQVAQRVLVVDDDPTVLGLVRPHLEAAGFQVDTAASTDEALRYVAGRGLPHLAIVDIGLPGRSGLELCREIHGYSDLPVIMLTALDDERTAVDSIRSFAEDYVTKPFRPRELAARAARVLRRRDDFSYAGAGEVVLDALLSIDLADRRATLRGERVPLTATETKILDILVRRRGRPVRTAYLLHRLWPQGNVFEDTLRVHVHRLRRKIEPEPGQPAYLLTERGVGYRLRVAAG